VDQNLEHNKAVVRRFCGVMNKKDFDELDDLTVPHLIRHCQATPGVVVSNREDFKAFLREDMKAFPDSQQNLKLLIAEGDFVAVYATYTGTQTGCMWPFPASGRRMEIDFCAMLRLEGGKIAEMWVTWDNVAGLTQLGHIQLPATRS
jgi:predicted ester cyclase